MKYTNYSKKFSTAALYALLSSATIVSLLFAGFFMVEPRVGHAVDSNEFYIRQTITDETSFLVQPSNVTMNGSITGVTGGTANGSTTFAVISNNANGYDVSIAFEDNAGAYAMLGDTTNSEGIRDYGGDVAGEPSYNFTASTAAQFAYTVTSLTSGDTDQSFHDGGATCNDGGGTDNGLCWKAPSTSGFQIIERNTSAVTGATSTIYFRVVVPSGSNPAVTADTYTATATLTLLTN
jgi:hypothetical protein